MRRVLIAEDESRIASFIEKGLRKHGFEAVSVYDGINAVHRAQAEPFDVLLLDLGLPGKDGWTVLHELRCAGHQLLIIIVTARGEIGDRKESLQRGANDYITKPFRFNSLLDTIQKHFSAQP